MGDQTSVEIGGVKELLRNLEKLEPKLRKKVERKGIKQGLKLLEAAARSYAPVGPAKGEGTRISNSFEIKTRTRKGVLWGGLFNRAPHSWIQEYGFFLTKKSSDGSKRIIKPVGDPYERGPNPFMRPALDEKGDDVIQEMREAAASALEGLKVR